VDDLAVLDHPHHELGHVHPDVEAAHVLGHVAPALHVGEQTRGVAAGVTTWAAGAAALHGTVTRTLAARRCPIERRAQGIREHAVGRHAGLALIIFHGGGEGLVEVDGLSQRVHGKPQAGPDGDHGLPALLARPSRVLWPADGHWLLGPAAATGCQIELPQLLELRMLGMQTAQITGGTIGLGHRCQHGFGIIQLCGDVEVLGEVGRIEPPAARMPGILEHGQRQFDLGGGDRIHASRRRHRFGEFEGAGLQPPVAGLADFGDHLARAAVETCRIDPCGLAAASRVKLRQRLPVVRGARRSRGLVGGLLADHHRQRVGLRDELLGNVGLDGEGLP
jgi:hypothetical protein